MEGELNVPIDLSKHNHPIIDGFFSQTFPESHIQSSLLGFNPYTHTISGLPTLSMLQGEPSSIQDLHSDSGLTHLSSLQPFTNQHLCDVNSLPVSLPQDTAHSDALRAVLSGRCSVPSSSSPAPSLNCVYNADTSNRWLIGTNGLQPDQFGGSMVSNDWMSQSYMNLCLADEISNANNELSLSLSAYSKPPVLNGGSSIHNHCSDMSCSDQHPSCTSTSRELSMSSGFNGKSSQFSQILSQSRYLSVVQDMLSEFANFSLENMDHQLNPYMNHCAEQGDSFKGSDESSNIGGKLMEAPAESLSRQRRETEAKKSQLLALLQMLDDCYNQCLDEIHTVISAFHAATELDPHSHACFALQKISLLYKSLKERISNQILKMGAHDDGGNSSDGGGASGASSSRDQIERSFEKSFIQKQWALQQLKRKDQQLWRPQRGLPERSVSVLRAWMFQNFLHPYPKDAEKHLLAIKSGLTRSQVSNWFINARVRLWKPLIEEMYAELNRSRAAKGHQTNEQSDTHNCLGIHNSRFSAS